MKTKTWVILLGLALLASCVVYVPYGEEGRERPEQERNYDRGEEGYPARMDTSYFYDTLAPYGVWVDYAPYGYVWVPRHVSYQWRPYTYGRWVWTDYGWTWVSYEPWGWIPFHYGRWGWARHLGWYWVPGTVWAPAWVTWRWGNFYIGWAPLPPNVDFIAGVGVPGLPYNFPDDHWIFIEGRYFQHDYLDRYVLPHERNMTVIKYTIQKSNLVAKNRQIINGGVDLDEVRRVTRGEIASYTLKDALRPGQTKVEAGAVSIYRPTVKKNELAKPKTVLRNDEAEERLGEIRQRDFKEKGTAVEPERQLKDDQEKELRFLEQSQESEDAELRRRTEDEKKLASTPAEREKVEKDYKVKAQELKKGHQEEKAKISQRHEEEKKVVKKTPPKKDVKKKN